MSLSKKKIDKKDYFRPLLSDTLTGDNLLVYSNDGFYLNCHKNISNGVDTIDKKFLNSVFKNLIKESVVTKPYNYYIKKTATTNRTLSLPHPAAQIDYCNFYKKYSDTMLNFCSLSENSIRAPHKVANSYYSKEKDISTKYKNLSVETLEIELSRRYPSSYFSYRGYSRFYRFFSDDEFTDLESSFSLMTFADISNCFGSIYTHSISWATKSKEFSKKNIPIKNQFCQELDKIISNSNYGETAGILVGSEFSRIFSEIILQRIDLNITYFLSEKHGLNHGVHYKFYRYVDDYIIFTNSKSELALILSCLSSSLEEYKLYINENKVISYGRPFSTEKGVLSSMVISDIEKMFSKILTVDKNESGKPTYKLYSPKKPDSFKKSFIDVVKSRCYALNGDYDSISSLVISILSNRIVRLIDGFQKIELKDEKTDFSNAVILLFDICFFFFSVSKQIKSSERLSKTILVADEHFREKMPKYLNYFRTSLFDRVSSLPLDIEKFKDVLNKTRRLPIEYINIILSTSDFGSPFRIRESILSGYLSALESPSYFEIIFFLYYCQNESQYSELIRLVEKLIIDKLNNVSLIKNSSEHIHLALDCIFCPYISMNKRKIILDKFMDACDSEALTELEKDELLQNNNGMYWFTKWNDLDMVNLLERKALIGRY